MSSFSTSFRIMTYNIHKGIGGVDRRYRPERIIETIAHCHPDIVCLQEVDDGVPRSRGDRQIDLLAESLGFTHRAFQKNVKLKKGHYGNAILSRFPMTDVEDLDLTIPLKKRRRAIVCHCRISDGEHSRTLLLVNTHLGLAGFERKMQIRRILDCDAVERTRSHTPVIIAGDFNDLWGALRRGTLDRASFLSTTHDTKTFPARLPMRALDHVFYRGDLELRHSYAPRTNLAKQASDHLPVVAEFRIR